MKEMHAELPLGPVWPNVATMLQHNAEKFADHIVFQAHGKTGLYEGITWEDFYGRILHIAFNLHHLFGFQPGDKMVIFSPNRLEMLELELAVMASGGIAVPIFAYFHTETAELLIRHCDARFLTVAGEVQLSRLSGDCGLEKIFVLDPNIPKKFRQQHSFSELFTGPHDPLYALHTAAMPDEICLNMYTSGTMGIPKCVQLTHRNILSQQAALDVVWDVNEHDRFLSYLPWHHSFGGIFELFTALSKGATYSLESSYGKDPQSIFRNWKQVRPTVFFSVPKVYQALLEMSRESKEAEDVFFHSGLKFIFTAAAALPEKLSNEFEKRNIPVIEGWGLTETAPCCTLTNPSLKRETGMVGKPIPGVSIRIGEEDEIQVHGPNVMVGYYRNEEADLSAFTPDGWYRTGDVGAITGNGLKLISRKDRIFKLSNGEKVIPTDLEKAIELKCHYVQYAVVAGSGEEHPVALIFPNRRLLEHPDYQLTPDEGCFCPRSLNELGRCLTGCLEKANNSIGQKFAKVRSAAVIQDELSLENNTLTPSLKMAPKNVMDKYKSHLKKLYGENVPVEEEVYVIELNPAEQMQHV